MAKEAILKKEANVKATLEKINQAKGFVAFDYQGLTVESFMDLRRRLRKAGCEIVVLKNNISRRASTEAGYEEFAASLVGPKAIAFSYVDEVSAARELATFAKENNKVVLGSGVIGGKCYDVNGVKAIALLPSRETLLTQLAAGMFGTLTQLSIGLNMLVEQGK